MRVAVPLLAVLAALLATAPDDAGACSCAYVAPEQRYEQADAAVIGTVIADDGTRGRIRVEHAFKADLGEELVLPTEGDSAACGLDLEAGERLGLFLSRHGDGWSASGCDYVDPDDLPGARERLPRPTGAGTAALLLSGEFSGGRLAVLDAEGLPIAYGPERDEVSGVSVCPGSEHVAELVVRGGSQWIAVRRLRDMRVLRERRAPWQGTAGDDVACLDRDARRLAASLGRRREGKVVVLSGGRLRTLHRGRILAVELAPPFALVAERARRRRILAVDLATGAKRVLRGARTDTEGWALSPDGTRAVGVSPGFDRDDGEGALVAARLRGPAAVRVRPLPRTFLLEATVLWTGADRLLLGGGGRRLERYDDRLRRVRRYDARLAPVLLARVGERVYGIDGDTLVVAEGPDLAVRELGRIPASGLSRLTAIPDPVQVAVGR